MNEALSIVPQTQRELTHNNYDENFDFKEPIMIGSTANIFCQKSNLRITNDEWDKHQDDYNLTALCKPDKTFHLYVDELPECKAWCPAEKPVPDNDTGRGH